MKNAGGGNDDDREAHAPRVDESTSPSASFYWPSHQCKPEENDVERPFSALEVRVLGLLLARRWLA